MPTMFDAPRPQGMFSPAASRGMFSPAYAAPLYDEIAARQVADQPGFQERLNDWWQNTTFFKPAFDELVGAATLPGDVYSGEQELYAPDMSTGEVHTDPGLVDRAGALAGSLEMGGLAMGPLKPANSVGIFGGKLAKTADAEKLKMAEDMAAQGVSKDDIWKSTGWFQGADGKWRFEIPDVAATFDPAASTAQMPGRLDLAQNIFQERFGLPRLGFANPKYSGATEEALKLADEQLAQLRAGTAMQPLSDVLSHEKLYAAYPEAANIPTARETLNTVAGTFNDGRITYGPAGKGGSDKSTLLHELQHYVQQKEGFARGGNSSEFAYQNSPVFNERRASESPVEAYRRLAGEVEARNVQERQFSPVQRPPWATADTPIEDQIISFDRGGPQASINDPPDTPLGPPPSIRAYHGSPHDYAAEILARRPDGSMEYLVGKPDALPEVPAGYEVVQEFPLGRPRMDKIGTGEGAQAYGHGWYAAENEGVGRDYRNKLSETTLHTADGSTFDPSSLEHVNVRVAARNNGENLDATIERARDLLSRAPPATSDMLQRDIARLEELKAQGGVTANSGHMYEVDIAANPEDFLDWDKPLSEQSAKVREAVSGLEDIKASAAQAPDMVQNLTGQTVYDLLRPRGVSATVARNAVAADPLRQAGIPGIKYLDQGSRKAGVVTAADGSDLPHNIAVELRNIYGGDWRAFKEAYKDTKSPSLREAIADIDARGGVTYNRPEGTSNFVVFDDAIINILRKYGFPMAPLAGGGAVVGAMQPSESQAAPPMPSGGGW